jgi:hypothetical protein
LLRIKEWRLSVIFGKNPAAGREKRVPQTTKPLTLTANPVSFPA